MDVNSLPVTVTRQRSDCDLNPGPSAPKSSTLTTRLPSHPLHYLPPKHPTLLAHPSCAKGRGKGLHFLVIYLLGGTLE